MYLTAKEVKDTYKVTRITLLKWEESGILKHVIKFPDSGHRRYLKSELEAVLGVKEDC